MSSIEDTLRFAAQNDLNVLLSGHAGIGKTTVMKNVLDDMGIKYLYFSASTLDPWVDFVGVPHEVTGEDGVKYLDLIRPKAFAYDTVEAIIMDEYNRAQKKVKNAVMELLQFKSINGKRLSNLKFIWAAINPSGEDDSGKVYDVEEMDPAQLDRFQIHLELPYTLNRQFFKSKYPKYVDATIEWWNALPQPQKHLISPRRMDMALDVFSKGGDIKWVLPKKINCTQLISSIAHGTFADRIKKAFSEQDAEKTKALLSDDDTVLSKYMTIIFKDNGYVEYFMPFVDDEKITALIKSDNKPLIDYLQRPDIFKSRLALIQSIVSIKSVKKGTLDNFKELLKNHYRDEAVQRSIKTEIVGEQYIDSADGSDFTNPWTDAKFVLYTDRMISLLDTTNDRKNVLNRLIELGYGIYDIMDIDQLKKTSKCILRIIQATNDIEYDLDKLNSLTRMLNSIYEISKRMGTKNFKHLITNDKDAEVHLNALKKISHSTMCAATLHPEIYGLYLS